jgi:hypothetical protein
MNHRLNEAINRLADLYEYGQLIASTDPSTLLHKACDEIEESREKSKPEKRPYAQYCPRKGCGAVHRLAEPLAECRACGWNESKDTT